MYYRLCSNIFWRWVLGCIVENTQWAKEGAILPTLIFDNGNSTIFFKGKKTAEVGSKSTIWIFFERKHLARCSYVEKVGISYSMHKFSESLIRESKLIRNLAKSKPSPFTNSLVCLNANRKWTKIKRTIFHIDS